MDLREDVASNNAVDVFRKCLKIAAVAETSEEVKEGCFSIESDEIVAGRDASAAGLFKGLYKRPNRELV